MNGMWGYKITDQEYKPAPELIRYLVGAAGRDANLLLNIGPQPDGELPAAAVERLQEIGPLDGRLRTDGAGYAGRSNRAPSVGCHHAAG